MTSLTRYCCLCGCPCLADGVEDANIEWIHDYHIISLGIGVIFSTNDPPSRTISQPPSYGPKLNPAYHKAQVVIHNHCLDIALLMCEPGSWAERKLLTWNLPKRTGRARWHVKEEKMVGKETEWLGMRSERQTWREGVEGSHCREVSDPGEEQGLII
jgi:hypothetical protein